MGGVVTARWPEHPAMSFDNYTKTEYMKKMLYVLLGVWLFVRRPKIREPRRRHACPYSSVPGLQKWQV